MSKRVLHKRVEVKWRDSASRGGWDEISAHRERREVGPVLSVGYLLSKDKDVVQLAQSQSLMTGQVTDTVTIPRENVIYIRKLRVEK